MTDGVRIALIRQRYNPFGGAERFVAATLEAMSRHEQVSLTLITRQWAGSDARHAVINCRPAYLGRLMRDVSFAACVTRLLRQQKFDIVQSHERIPGCNIFRAGDGVHAAWLAQRRRQQSWLGQLGALLSPWHRYTLWAEKKLFADPRLKAVICNSEYVRKDILQFYAVPAHKLHVIYNGVDLKRFNLDVRSQYRHQVRQGLGLADTAPVLLFVGSGFERKGVGRLLEALALSGLSHVTVVIVGADKRLARYRDLAASLGVGRQVFFVGGVDDVRPYYAVADAFALPTLYEPLPNAVLEALACGLPCLVSNQCGAAELIRPGANGYVCDPLDLTCLAESLTKLVALSTNQDTRLAARGAVAHLGLAEMSKQLLQLYRSVL